MSTTRKGGSRRRRAVRRRRDVQRGRRAEEGELAPPRRPGRRRASGRAWPATMSSKSARLAASRVALVATMRTAVGARARGRRRRTRPARRGCARSPPARAGRCVDALTEPHDLHPAEQVDARGRPAGRRRRAGGWSWCRSRWRRPGSRRLLARQGAGPGGPPLPHALDGPVADRVHAGPDGERVPGQRVQALDPVGHAARGHPRGQHVARVARGEVGLVRRQVPAARARGRWPARPATRASGRPTPAGWRRRWPAGRSGSTASGTGCRPPAAARSRRRRAGRRGTGARPPRARGAPGRAAGRRSRSRLGRSVDRRRVIRRPPRPTASARRTRGLGARAGRRRRGGRASRSRPCRRRPSPAGRPAARRSAGRGPAARWNAGSTPAAAGR